MNPFTDFGFEPKSVIHRPLGPFISYRFRPATITADKSATMTADKSATITADKSATIKADKPWGIFGKIGEEAGKPEGNKSLKLKI
jgi:hypothetical protein